VLPQVGPLKGFLRGFVSRSSIKPSDQPSMLRCSYGALLENSLLFIEFDLTQSARFRNIFNFQLCIACLSRCCVQRSSHYDWRQWYCFNSGVLLARWTGRRM